MAFLDYNGLSTFKGKIVEWVNDKLSSYVKSVNGTAPGATGNVDINKVSLADNLSSEYTQDSYGEFVIRTTGGNASLSDGTSWVVRILGNINHTGVIPEVIEMEVHQAERDGGVGEISATINKSTFKSYVNSSGTTTLTYTNSWSANPANYGITVSGTPISGDSIVIEYVKEDPGTITTATPTSFRSTGFNLYKHSSGYAYVHKYSESYGFRISGSYTSLSYSRTAGGTRTTITPVSGMFTVPDDGYVWVVGGNNTDTCIIATWSDWTTGYPDDWEAYTESIIDILPVMDNYFPYGLLRADDVRDEIDLNTQTAYSRINRIAYSAQNLASAIASGRAYEYDNNYIYVEKATADTYSISVNGSCVACDHGMEFVTGTTVPVYVETIYGSNLKNRLERDVLTISSQTLSDAQKTQVQQNIGVMHTVHLALDLQQDDCDPEDLAAAMIERMTEDGIYIFSGSWRYWSWGYDAICIRRPYNSDNSGYSGTIYSQVGNTWTFTKRTNTDLVITEGNHPKTVPGISISATGISGANCSAVKSGNTVSIMVHNITVSSSIGHYTVIGSVPASLYPLQGTCIVITCPGTTNIAQLYINSSGVIRALGSIAAGTWQGSATYISV